MKLKRKLVIAAFLIFLTPSSLFAGTVLTTGYDLYQNIRTMENPKNPEHLVQEMYVSGFLDGYLDGLVTKQDDTSGMRLSQNHLSIKTIEKSSKKLDVHRLNIPKGGLPIGQIILIYQRYAEKHPEKLNESAKLCIFQSLVDAYGWK